MVLQDHYRKRDVATQARQATVGSALAALGSALSPLLLAAEDVSKEELVQGLADASRLLTGLFHDLSMDRRAVLLPRISDKVAAEVLASSTPDSLLFGEDLGSRLQATRKLEKESKDLMMPPKSSTTKLRFKPSGNGRGLHRTPSRPFAPVQANRSSGFSAPQISRPYDRAPRGRFPTRRQLRNRLS